MRAWKTSPELQAETGTIIEIFEEIDYNHYRGDVLVRWADGTERGEIIQELRIWPPGDSPKGSFN